MRIPGQPDRSDESDDSPRMAVFIRGLTIGALVGAAIAESALWERARRRVEHEARETEPGLPDPGPSEPAPSEPALPGSNATPADG
jgi:hypothetical protein